MSSLLNVLITKYGFQFTEVETILGGNGFHLSNGMVSCHIYQSYRTNMFELSLCMLSDVEAGMYDASEAHVNELTKAEALLEEYMGTH